MISARHPIVPDELARDISRCLLPQLNHFFANELHSVFVETINYKDQKSYKACLARLLTLWKSLYLYIKGALLIKDNTLRTQLIDYLKINKVDEFLLCIFQLDYASRYTIENDDLEQITMTDLQVDELHRFEQMGVVFKEVSQNHLNQKDPSKFILDVSEYHPHLQAPSDYILDSTIKDHLDLLAAQLQNTQEYALSLHIALVMLFTQIHSGCLIHMTGKSIPAMIKELEPFLRKRNIPGTDLFSFLKDYQRKIVQTLKSGATDASLVDALTKLKEVMQTH